MMGDGPVNLSSCAILVISLILITHLLILSDGDAQYYSLATVIRVYHGGDEHNDRTC